MLSVSLEECFGVRPLDAFGWFIMALTRVELQNGNDVINRLPNPDFGLWSTDLSFISTTVSPEYSTLPGFFDCRKKF